MPTIPTRLQQPSPVTAQVEMPAEFPPVPQEILNRFPSAKGWNEKLKEFWTRSNAAIQSAQEGIANYSNSRVVYSVDSFLIYAKNGIAQPMFALDSTGVKLGDVLVINTPGRKVYIGQGTYANNNTPFYIDTTGRFSLGANLTWDPATSTLTITGTINATSGTIGGFTIGSDYIRDTVNSFGLSSTVTGGDDVRFWAGATFANRATAPFRLLESGAIFSSSGTIGGFTLGANALTATNLSINNSSSPSIVLTETSLQQITISPALGVYIGLGANNSVLTWSHILFSDNTAGGSAEMGSGGSAGFFNMLTAGVSVLYWNGYQLTFQTDTNLYRSAANTLKTDDAFVCASLSTVGIVQITANTTNAAGNAGSIHKQAAGGLVLQLATGSVFDFSMESPSGAANIISVPTGTLDLVFAGSIKTATPTAGAAGAWKLGQYTAGVAVQAGKVRVNIDGADVDLLTA